MRKFAKWVSYYIFCVCLCYKVLEFIITFIIAPIIFSASGIFALLIELVLLLLCMAGILLLDKNSIPLSKIKENGNCLDQAWKDFCSCIGKQYLTSSRNQESIQIPLMLLFWCVYWIEHENSVFFSFDSILWNLASW